MEDRSKSPEERMLIYVVDEKQRAVPELPIVKRLDPNRADGDSIAEKKDFSELRAHYWVWKNAPLPDRVGFYQFRRYLDLSGKDKKLPYYISASPSAELFSAAEKYRDYDVIAPLPEYTGETVADRYARFHRREDLQFVCRIIDEEWPDYSRAKDKYVTGNSEYYCNLYLMRGEVFSEYCEWLFAVLFRFGEQADSVEPRVFGYLAERLFGIWYTKKKEENRLKCTEVARVHFSCFDDSTHHFKRDAVIDFFLPPGSRLRAFARKILFTVKA